MVFGSGPSCSRFTIYVLGFVLEARGVKDAKWRLYRTIDYFAVSTFPPRTHDAADRLYLSGTLGLPYMRAIGNTSEHEV